MALLLHRLAQLGDLRGVQEELPPAHGIGVRPIALLVGRNVELQHVGLARFDRGVRLREARLTAAQALDLGAGQHEPGLEGFEDVVIVAGAPVLGDDFLGRFGRSHERSHDRAGGTKSGAEGGI